MIDIEQILEKL